jgi:hypothetical protein
MFLIYYSVFLFVEQGQSIQGAVQVYPRGSCGSTACHLFAHLLFCISQAGLVPVSGSVRALHFLSVPRCGEVWIGWGFVMSEFCFFLLFFSANCGSSISKRFFIYGAHAVCFLPLVTILDLSQRYSYGSKY